jgi:pilus assembly protein Flp/PilA
MHHLTRALVLTTRPERGATAVEYGLMIALIAMAIFGGIYLLGPNLDAIFDEVAASL